MKKVALVTGASSGIGKSTVLKLLTAGCIVYGVARRIEKMRDIQEKGAHVLSMDITDETSIEKCIHAIISAHQKIDILVNNAGYGSYGAIEDVSIHEAKRQFDVNLFGLARLTQLVLPHMRKNRFGKIINISSMGGKIYSPMGGWYHATKFALEGFSDCLRFEVKPFGIDVIVIEPGGIKTEWGAIAGENLLRTSGATAYQDMARKTAQLFASTYRNPKISQPDVIADTIVQVVTTQKPKSRYAVGYRARPYIFLRKILPDRVYDYLLARSLK